MWFQPIYCKRNLVSFSERGKKAALCSSSAAHVTGPRPVQRRGLERRQLLGRFSAVIVPAGCTVCHVEARLDLFLGGVQLESSRWSLKPPVFLQPVRSEDSCLTDSELVLQYIYILFWGLYCSWKIFWFSFVEEHGQLDTALLGAVSRHSGTVRWGWRTA